jgi:hypothetical protein
MHGFVIKVHVNASGIQLASFFLEKDGKDQPFYGV